MASHPIIALWAHPRSMSTAMERLMRARGDLTCFHEPFLYDYYIHRQVRMFPHFEPAPGKPVSYAQTRNELLKAAETGPVFLKDHAYYVVPQIFDDPEFLGRITHSYLIRDPRRALASYQKLDDSFTEEEAGLGALRTLYDAAPGPIIAAEDVRTEPKAMLRAYWSAVGLEYREEAFEWSGAPDDWSDVTGWHGAVSASTAIAPDVDDADELFTQAAAKAPRLKALLASQQPHYDWLKAKTLPPIFGP